MLAIAGRAGRWLAISLGLAVLLFLGLVVSGPLLERQLAGYVRAELEKQIATRLTIGSFNVSLVRKLPYATFTLHNVVVYSYDAVEGRSGTDTLLYASEVFLHFNLLRLLEREIELNHLTIRSGFVQPQISQRGRTNYEIFRMSATENQLRTSLRDVKIQNFEVGYANYLKQFELKGGIRSLTMQGNFEKANFELNIESKTWIHYALAKGRPLIFPMEPAMKLTLSKAENHLVMTGSWVEINKQRIVLSGSFTNKSPAYVDLAFEARDLDVLKTLRMAGRMVPDSLSETLKVNGSLSLSGTVKGLVSVVVNPSIKGAFALNQGSLKVKGLATGFEKIKLRGNFSNGRSKSLSGAELIISEGTCITEGELLSLNGQLVNFLQPTYSCRLKGKAGLSLLTRLFKNLPFMFTSGNARFDLQLEGQRGAWVNPARTAGILALHEAAGNWGGWEFDHLNCTLEAQKTWKMEAISGNLGSTALTGGVEIMNPVALFSPQVGIPVINLNLHSPFIDLARLAPAGSPGGTFALPDSVAFYGTINSSAFRWDQLEASNLSATFEYQPGLLVFHDFAMQSLGGAISGGGAFTTLPGGRFNLRVGAQLKDIEISHLFKSFRNFGQEFIGHQHLSGRLSGEVQYAGHFDTALQVVPATIVTSTDVTIYNGRLTNFEPMLGLSRYISVDELKDVRFSTLHNQISIRDRIVSIPLMEIRSNAFNISASGTHTFDNGFDYRLQVFLSEILWKKRKKPKVIEENGYIADDGAGKTRLHLKITGSPEDYDVALDREKSRESLNESLRKQGEEIRNLFKNNETGGQEQALPGQGQNQSLFRWEEAEEQPNDDVEKPYQEQSLPKDTAKGTDKLQFEWGE